MSKKAQAVLGLAAAGYAVYRATRSIGDAAEVLRRRGPRWDVIVPGAIAALMLISAVSQADAAIGKARRAF
jgi:hypothetical protein